MKKIILLLLVLSGAFHSTAQDFQLGKVKVEELKEKQHPRDTSAVAAVLFKKARTFFTYTQKAGFIANHEVKYRIKIYKKEGLKWATFAVPYYIGYEELSPDAVKFSEAVTYNLDEDKITKTKLNSDGNFVEKINKYWTKASITLPNVKVGSVIEFKYVHKSENIFKLPEMILQYNIPVNNFEYTTEIPDMYIYKSILNGYVEVNSTNKITKGSCSFENEFRQMSHLNFTQINTKYAVQNVPALHEENFVDNIENYTSKIQQELERIRYTDKPDKDYSITWEGVSKTIFKEKEFGAELQKGKYFVPYVSSCVHGKTTQTEKMEAIFKHVQEKMNWDKTFGVYVDKGVEKAYETSTGNVAEINFILINMLNMAGFNASPVLASTIDNGVSVFPGRTGFNYVMVSVVADGKSYLLDAANKFTAPNVYPLPLVNWSGRMLQSDGNSTEVKLTDTALSKSLFGINAKIDATGVLKGTYKNQVTDFEALAFREKNADLTTEAHIEKIESQHNGLTISNYSITNLKTDLSKPLVESYSFEIEHSFDVIGNKMYLNPLLFLKELKNPFNTQDRKMPIYFGPTKQEKFIIGIEMPKGYVLENLPTPIRLEAQDNVASFSYNAKLEENVLQVVVSSQINKVIVSLDYYEMLKEFFQRTIDKLNEKIVLKKA
jgi:Domain of Unknown Function with PDB structure (DUF3857)